MIAGCYHMHLYCENHQAMPNTHGHEYRPADLQGETAADCFRQARKAGWKISRDKQSCWCPKCTARGK